MLSRRSGHRGPYSTKGITEQQFFPSFSELLDFIEKISCVKKDPDLTMMSTITTTTTTTLTTTTTTTLRYRRPHMAFAGK